MKLTNCLKKEEPKKEECKIEFYRYIENSGAALATDTKPEEFAYIDVIAILSSRYYLFEAYQLINEKGTANSYIYIGTWNGVEQ